MIPEYNHENIFAKILRKEIPSHSIFETEYAYAFNDVNPQASIHILVIPKGDYVSFEDFYHNASSTEIQDFHHCINQVIQKMNIGQNQGGNGFRVVSNVGPDGGQEVPHYHIHILAGRKFVKIVCDNE